MGYSDRELEESYVRVAAAFNSRIISLLESQALEERQLQPEEKRTRGEKVEAINSINDIISKGDTMRVSEITCALYSLTAREILEEARSNIAQDTEVREFENFLDTININP